MEVRTYRVARSACLVFAGIHGALVVLWLGVAWKRGAVAWAPLALLGGVAALGAWWLWRHRLEFSEDELRVVTPFAGERRVVRREILGVDFVAPSRRGEGPFTLAIHLRDGSQVRLNAKPFTREAVKRLLELAPETRRAA